MDVHNTHLPGCLLLDLDLHEDERGVLVKTFHADTFRAHGLNIEFREIYYTKSLPRVLRGLHFQIPPFDHHKLVTCIHGEVMDVVVDLRNGSPTYGRHNIFSLGDNHPRAVMIPPGLAHGFYVHRGPATVLYKTTTVWNPSHDAGILWNTLGIPWPDTEPILSERDRTFPEFASFRSPFRFPTQGR